MHQEEYQFGKDKFTSLEAVGESSKLKFQAIKVFEILKFSYLKKVWISLNTNYKKNAPFFELF